MAAGILIAVVISLIFVLSWLFQSSKTKKLINKIPGPAALPIIGNAHQLKTDGGEFYKQVLGYGEEYQKYGMLKLMLGIEPVIAVFSPNTVEVVLNSSKHMSKSYLYKFLHPWLRTGLLTSTGDKWKTRRRLLTPSFHFRILQDFLQVFNEQSKIMVEKLNTQVGKNEFDMFPFITLCALDIICDTAMGTNVKAQADKDSEYVKVIYEISELIQQRQKKPWLWPDFIFDHLSAGKRHKYYLQVLHGFTEKVIKERSAEFDEEYEKQSEELKKNTSPDELPAAFGKKKRLAFLDMLLYANKQGAAMDDLDIREEVDTFMFEGHDTTAAAANWAVHLIGANPDVQQKLHDEMDQIFGDSDRPVEMDDIKNMKYLECVVKEALRLFPSVPMYGRTISEDCVIGGYDVPKGTQAIILTSALHRNPEHFPDPESFLPDRWLTENCAGRHPYCYVPFSAGLRNCIGQKFAMNEEKVLLSSIMRNFTIHSCQSREELEPVGEVILRPAKGILVKLTPRCHSAETIESHSVETAQS